MKRFSWSSLAHLSHRDDLSFPPDWPLAWQRRDDHGCRSLRVGRFSCMVSGLQIARPKSIPRSALQSAADARTYRGHRYFGVDFPRLVRFRTLLARPAAPMKPPSSWLLGLAACVWATLWYALVLLAFGIAPQFPPGIAMGGGILLAGTIVFLLPRWTAHPNWSDMHQFGTLFGVILVRCCWFSSGSLAVFHRIYISRSAWMSWL